MNARRYEATLLGIAVGDVLGLPLETMRREEILHRHGRVVGMVHNPTDSYTWHRDRRPGEWSDDTILSLAVAESLVTHGYDLDAVAQAHVHAINACRSMDGSQRGGFGKTTLRAVERLAQGISPLTSGVIGSGNGTCMKTAPIGLYSATYGSHAETFAAYVGKMTHLDPRSIAAGVAHTAGIRALVRDATRATFLDTVIGACVAYESPAGDRFIQGPSLADTLRWVRTNRNAPVHEAERTLGTGGLAWQSYPFSVFMFQRHWDDPIDGLLETVRAGGDADSNAAMVGAMIGARFGDIFPPAWTETVENTTRLRTIGRALYGNAR